jgi:hypothetical protein|eukprot:COSAG06_NODE_3593_length_5143_cov_2.358247_4_plen_70_part_00
MLTREQLLTPEEPLPRRLCLHEPRPQGVRSDTDEGVDWSSICLTRLIIPGEAADRSEERSSEHERMMSW